MFIGMIMVPITLYLYLAHASWAWMYMIDPSDIPGFAILPLVVLHGAMIVAGWYLGARLIQADRHKLVGYIALGAGVVSLVAAALLWGRLGHYGSYTEFHEGRSLPIMDVKLGYVLVVLLFAILASIGFMAVELIRDSRRAVSR